MKVFRCRHCGYKFYIDDEQIKPTGCPSCLTRNPDGYHVSKDKPDTVVEVKK